MKSDCYMGSRGRLLLGTVSRVTSQASCPRDILQRGSGGEQEVSAGAGGGAESPPRWSSERVARLR